MQVCVCHHRSRLASDPDSRKRFEFTGGEKVGYSRSVLPHTRRWTIPWWKLELERFKVRSSAIYAATLSAMALFPHYCARYGDFRWEAPISSLPNRILEAFQLRALFRSGKKHLAPIITFELQSMSQSRVSLRVIYFFFLLRTLSLKNFRPEILATQLFVTIG